MQRALAERPLANRFRELPARLQRLIASQAAAAVTACALLARLPHPSHALLFLGLAAAGLAAGALKIELSARWGRITMAFAVTYFALLSLGAGPAIVVNALAALGGLCRNQRE